MSTDNQYPGLIKAWLAFTRPKTWLLAISPVVAALALAWVDSGTFRTSAALFTLSIAVLMQAITNMENDLGYAERNAETGNRRGLPRATTRGWISRPTAQIAIRVVAMLALLNTAVLIWLGGWVFLLIGLASLTAAYCYMGGPKPIAYTPFGEIMVLVFFGLTAVCGTYYLQTDAITANALLLGVALGTIATGVLAVNNFRDIEHDASIGRMTLPVTIGPKRFFTLFACMMMMPFIALIIIVALHPTLWPCLITCVCARNAAHIIRELQIRRHEELNTVMFDCVQFEFTYASLFTISILASSLGAFLLS